MYEFEEWNLMDIVTEIFCEFPNLTSVFLFGSRAYKTNSKRSDIDLLVKFEGTYDSSKLRNIQEKYKPLDLFVNHGNMAMSLANNSAVHLRDENDTLENQLDAIKIWTKDGDFSEYKDYFIQETLVGVNWTKSYIPPSISYNMFRNVIVSNSFSNLEIMHLEEAIKCYSLECWLSFISMIGVFYEELLIELCVAYKRRVISHFPSDLANYESRVINARISSDRLNNFIDFLINKGENNFLKSNGINSINDLHNCFDVIRKYRNNVDHPDPTATLFDRLICDQQYNNFICYVPNIKKFISHL